MPTTKVYDKHGAVKVDPLASGRIINVTEQSADTDSVVAWEVGSEEVISRRVNEQFLSSFERENLNDGLPKAVEDAQFCGAGNAAYSYSNALTELKNEASKSPNETHSGVQATPRTDQSKGHGAAPPIHHPSSIPRSYS